MAEYVIMPKLEFNMDKGQLVKWHKEEGAPIEKGEVLFEVMTDKTTMEIESTVGGVVRKLLIEEGETVPIALPIAIIADADENIDEMINEALAKLGKAGRAAQEEPQEPETAVEAAPKADKPSAASELKLTPRARKYIKENKIDITGLDIKGTGHKGAVTERDIEDYIKNNRAKITPLAQKIAQAETLDISGVKGTGIGGKILKADVEPLAAKPEAFVQPTEDKEILNTIPYTGMRKVIGDRLSQSKYTSPHLYFTTSVDMSKLFELRRRVNEAQPQKVSVTDFIVASAANALQKHPMLNSSLIGDKIVQYKTVNIGVAVALDNGLIVPVIRDAQAKKVTRISEEARSLVDKARAGKLMPEEYKGGTFTVSNLGMFGIENFTAIINPPETAILGVSAVIKKPVVITEDGEDKIAVRPMMNMTLSVDHRLIDGLTATQFINEVKALLENPINILI